MEEPPEELRKNASELLESFLYSSSESSLSSSCSLMSPIGIYGEVNTHEQKRDDYLSRLFEKKKLKEKSLSKKMKTPLDRKLYRTCWPVKLGKVTRIKKKPKEKKRKKPTNKSLRRKKMTSSSLLNIRLRFKCSFLKIVRKESDEMSFTKCLRKCHFMYEPITPQLLVDVLKDPEHLESGATINTIITKLRALKLHLNPALDLLREELLQKLNCGIKLGLVVEKQGFFKVSEALANKRLSRKKIDAFWNLWYRDVSYKK